GEPVGDAQYRLGLGTRELLESYGRKTAEALPGGDPPLTVAVSQPMTAGSPRVVPDIAKKIQARGSKAAAVESADDGSEQRVALSSARFKNVASICNQLFEAILKGIRDEATGRHSHDPGTLGADPDIAITVLG